MVESRSGTAVSADTEPTTGGTNGAERGSDSTHHDTDRVDAPQEYLAEADATGPDAAALTVTEAESSAASPLPRPDWDQLVPYPGPGMPSPDGNLVAYLQPRGANQWSLMLTALATGETAEIETDFAIRPAAGLDGDVSYEMGPQWSRDGRTLALTGGHPTTGKDAIWLLNLETGESRLLLDHDAADRGPRWSLDGEWIAYTTRLDAHDRIAIVRVTAPDETPAVPILLTDGLQDDRDPVWLNNGYEIAYRRRLVDPATDDLYVVSVATAELRQITGRSGRTGIGSQPASRKTLAASPDKTQVAYASSEKDWDFIAIANTENGTGWTLAGEAGDKFDPHWSSDGKKIAYCRVNGTAVRVCAKGTSAAVSEVLDPGDGVARHPRWLPDGRIVYWFADPTHAPFFIVQEPSAKAERRVVVPRPLDEAVVEAEAVTAAAEPGATVPGEPASEETVASEEPVSEATAVTEAQPTEANAAEAAANEATADTAPAEQLASAAATSQPADGTADPKAFLPPAIDGLVAPGTIEVKTSDNLKLPGLLYRPARVMANVLAVSLGDGPPVRQEARLSLLAQRLVSDGVPIYEANLRGTPGLGRGIVNGLAEAADIEVEADDVAETAATLRALADGLPQRQVLIGRGFGGTLALVAAGARTGTVQGIVAVDPITDWDAEFDHTDPAARLWFQRVYGLPASERGRYALRTPATFVGIINAPILLISTAQASAGRQAQLFAFSALLDELQVPYERFDAPDDATELEIAGRIAEFVHTLV